MEKKNHEEEETKFIPEQSFLSTSIIKFKSEAEEDLESYTSLLKSVINKRTTNPGLKTKFTLEDSQFIIETKKMPSQLTISLLSFDPKNKHFTVSKAAIDFFLNLKGETHVLSISGEAAIGKSTFLNVFLAIAAQFGEYDVLPDHILEEIPIKIIFNVGDGTQSTTQGVDIYHMKIGYKNLIVLDIEGDNDPNRQEFGGWFYTNLITTAISLSHFHCYHFPNIPQQTFVKYINSASLISQYGSLKKKDKTLFLFIKRDYFQKSDNQRIQDESKLLQSVEKDFKKDFKESFLFLLKMPTNHILNVDPADSCINSREVICKDCQKDKFFKTILNLFFVIKHETSTIEGYRDGKALFEDLERILDANVKQLPFSHDNGSIAKFRMLKLLNEKERILQMLNNVKSAVVKQNLAHEVQQMVIDYPDLFPEADCEREMLNSIQNLLNNIIMIITRINVMLIEFKRYIETQVMDKSFSVMNIEELEAITQTYVTPLRGYVNELKIYIEEYQNDIAIMFSKSDEVYQVINDALKVFKEVKKKGTSSVILGIPGIASSAILAIVAREMAIKVVGGIIAGSTVIGVGLALYSVYGAKKSVDKKLEKMRREKLLEENTIIINGEIQFKGNVEILEEAMKFFEDFGKKFEDKKAKIANIEINKNKIDELLNFFEECMVRKYESDGEIDFTLLLKLLCEAEEYSMKIREIL